MQQSISETEDPRQGAILGMVMVIVVVVSILGAGLMHYAGTLAAETGRAVSAAQAFWAAEAGVQRLLAIGRGAGEPLEDLGYVGADVFGEGNVLRGVYHVDVDEDPSLERVYYIKSTGVSKGKQTNIVDVNSELPTFGQYLMFSNIDMTPDDQPIYFGDGDIIAGPIYVNGEINIWHDHPNQTLFEFPSPEGDLWRIKSAASTYNIHAATEDVFKDDGSMHPELDYEPQNRLDLNQPLLSTEPLQEFFTEKKASADLSLSGDYDMEFRDDGKVVYHVHGDESTLITNNYAASGKLSIHIDGEVSIHGVVEGDVSLAVEHGIHVDGDVEYASARSPNPWESGFNGENVDDSLTLLSREYVRIESDPDLGEEGRNLHASIYVTEDNNGEFYGLCAEDWNRNIKVTGEQPSLNLYGGVSQYRRGLLARPPNVDAPGTSPQPFGYKKNFLYDMRMAEMSSPYTTYLVSGWRYR